MDGYVFIYVFDKMVYKGFSISYDPAYTYLLTCRDPYVGSFLYKLFKETVQVTKKTDTLIKSTTCVRQKLKWANLFFIQGSLAFFYPPFLAFWKS